MRKVIAVLISVVLLCSCSPRQASDEINKTYDEIYTPQYGGTLKIYSYNSDTLNPLYTKNKANAQMLMLIFDNLIKCDESQRAVPVLASDFGVSPDGLVWTINLKHGIKWHDGSDFTANDVASTLNAVKNNTNNSPYKNNLQNVVKIENIANSVIISLKAPQTNFINLLEIPIVKASEVNTYNNFTPIGTGQYEHTEKTHKVIYLTSNKSWWTENTPYIDNVEVYLLPDKNTSVYAFEAKEIDIVTTDIRNWGKYSGISESNSFEYNSGRYNFLSFNINNKYLSNNSVRIAVAHAINKNRIFEEIMLSHGTLTDTFMNPNWWVYNENVKKYNYNPSLSMSMLIEQDLNPNDMKIELLVNDDNKIRMRVAEIIKEQLKDIGLDIKLKSVSWENFNALISSGSYDMYLGEVNYSTEINPQYILQGVEQFDPLLQQLQSQTTDDGRKFLYHEIQKEYAAFLPALPLYFDSEALLYNSKIHGELNPLRNNIFNNAYQWYIVN